MLPFFSTEESIGALKQPNFCSLWPEKPNAVNTLVRKEKAQRGEYVSPEGKSRYQLLEDFINVVENQSEEVGMDVQETDDSNAAVAETAATAVAVEDKEKTDPVSVDGKLIRLAAPFPS